MKWFLLILSISSCINFQSYAMESPSENNQYYEADTSLIPESIYLFNRQQTIPQLDNLIYLRPANSNVQLNDQTFEQFKIGKEEFLRQQEEIQKIFENMPKTIRKVAGKQVTIVQMEEFVTYIKRHHLPVDEKQFIELQADLIKSQKENSQLQSALNRKRMAQLLIGAGIFISGFVAGIYTYRHFLNHPPISVAQQSIPVSVIPTDSITPVAARMPTVAASSLKNYLFPPE